ncbi:MAG: glycosyltransferase family 4 protein [Acidobacteriota bacterium]
MATPAIRAEASSDEPLPVRGHIDRPHGSELLPRGPVVIRGWALGLTSRVSRVEARVDGRLHGYAGLGRVRSDVAAVLEDAEGELSGFELRFDGRAPDLRADRACLLVRVTLCDGTAAEFPPIDVAFAPRTASSAVSGPDRRRRSWSAGAAARMAFRKVRLLCVARSLDCGGSQLRLKELVEHLHARSRFACTVVAPSDGPLRGDLEAAGAAVRVQPLPVHDAGAYDAAMSGLEEWAAGRFDLVLAATLSSFPAVELAERLGVPSVYRIGEIEPLASVASWLSETLHPAIEARAEGALDRATLLLFNSEAARRTHRQRGGMQACEVIPSSVDVAGARAFASSTDRAACRERLGFAPDRRVVVCAGTIWPVKGQALLVWALEQLRHVHPSLACVLVGQQFDPYAEALGRYVVRHDLEEQVRLVPFTDDLRPWLHAADIAACPSESESMPASVLEAMAFGVPILAARVGGVPEAVQDGASGWLFPPSDLGALVAALDRAARASPAELRALGDGALRAVAAAHDRRHALPRAATLLWRVARSRRAATGSGDTIGS